MDENRAFPINRDMLTRKVTLDEYFAPYRELVRKDHVSQSVLDRKKTDQEALARPGDEWWEYVIGSEPLMQIGGLVLLRDGEIIWMREFWIS